MIRLSDLLAATRCTLTPRAGGDGADPWVRWALTVDDIDGIARLTGGELVLTAGGWHRSASDADRFARALSRRGAAALGFAVRVPDDLVAACERVRLPLLEVPEGALDDGLVEEAIALILDRRGADSARWLEHTRTLAGALGARHGIRSVLDALWEEHGARFWLLGRGAVFVADGRPAPSNADLRAVAATADGEALDLGDGRRAAVVPLGDGARLVCESPDPVAVEHARSFLGAQLAAMRSVRDARRPLGRELVARLAAGDTSPDELSTWLRALGVEPRGHATCIVVRAPGAGARELEELGDALEDIADALEVPRIVATAPGEAVAFVFAGDADREAEDAVARAELLLEPALRRAGAAPGTSSVIARDVGDIVRALLEARRVAMLNMLHEPEPEAAGDEPAVPLAAVLIAEQASARAGLHASLLAPLAAYDEAHDTELVRTLDVFLSTCGQWSASATRLGIHVNTLRYRLARVEKCTGRDLGSMADRVDFYVALRIPAAAPPERAAAPDPTR
jgi:sugar diacid utilization regulator